MPWVSIAKKVDFSSTENGDKIRDYGKVIYNQQCSRCHGADLNGMSNIPSLKNLKNRYNALNLASIISKGKGSMMPMPQISKTQIDLLTAYLLEDNSINVEVASLQEIDPNFSPYSVNYFGRFMDENGYPTIKPPWGLSLIHI